MSHRNSTSYVNRNTDLGKTQQSNKFINVMSAAAVLSCMVCESTQYVMV